MEKERKRRKKEKGAKIVFHKDLTCGFRQGVLPKRYLRLHIVGLVYARAIHDSNQQSILDLKANHMRSIIRLKSCGFLLLKFLEFDSLFKL